MNGPVSPTLVITRGLPASGKTTYAREWVAEDPPRRARVNRDDLRHNLWGVYWGLDYRQENQVTAVQQASVRALLSAGVSVIVDDTHLALKYARPWAELAAMLGVGFEVVDIKTPLEVCVQRDAARDCVVGVDVIKQMAMRYGLHRNWLPPVPAVTTAGNAGSVRQYEPDTSLPTCWIVDVDGTLAHMNGRGPFEWTRVGEDFVDHDVRDIVYALHGLHDIVVVSGRDGSCLAETKSWLDRHKIAYDALFMRKPGDNRKDAIVKQEILFDEIAPRWNVRGVLDDRDQVVAMWRSVGLKCLQVAEGAF